MSVRSHREPARKRALAVACAAGMLACLGALTTAFLWRNPDVWDGAARGEVVFRVQSRSMEPEYRGPQFWQTCPNCRASFAVAFDAPPTVAANSELVETDGISGATEGLDPQTSRAAQEAARIVEKTRALTCPHCGYDRAPVAGMRFENGATVTAARPGAETGPDSFWRRVQRALRRETDPEFRAREAAESAARPERWDVVVFRDALGRLTLKRVVGLPGERVAICNGDLVVDGRTPYRSLKGALGMAAPIPNVEFRRSDRRVDAVGVVRVWQDGASKTLTNAVSNESSTPCLNGTNVAPVELVRDFILNFNWYADDGATTKFAALARRPESACLLEFNEADRSVVLRVKPLFNGAASSGKPFASLDETDFANEPGRRVELDGELPKNARFSVATLDGSIRFAINGEERARFELDDWNSTAAAAIDEPFALLGDVARAANLALFRDLHYSNASEPLTAESARERTETLAGRETQIPPGRYFLLGDNSPASVDSRFDAIGTVDGADILFVLPQR